MIRMMLFLFFVCLCLRVAFSDEIDLKDATHIEYKSIFSKDETGITFELDHGLRFVAWSHLKRSDAETLSDGKYESYRVIREEREREITVRDNRISKELRVAKPQAMVSVSKNLPLSISTNESISMPYQISKAKDLIRILDKDGKLWHVVPEAFMAEQDANGFMWVTHHGVARSSNVELRFLGFRIWEAIVRFSNDALSQITISLYNRGDAGDMDEEVFHRLIIKIEKKIDEWIGKESVDLPDLRRGTSIRIYGKVWTRKPYRLDLEWSITNNTKRPEFLRLRIAPLDDTFDPHRIIVMREDKKAKAHSFFDLKNNVQREKSGNILINNVPMVDQGNKGYCAVAVAERVLRFYGRDVDQHELAQLAKTSAVLGTDPGAMLGALRRISRKQKIRMQTHEEYNIKDFKRLVRRYNRLAKRQKLPQVFFSSNQIMPLSDIYHRMNYQLLKELSLKRETDMEKFQSNIRKYINVGIPLAWSVIVGIVKEDPPVKNRGGHMRLIIGYNKKRSQIFYSDTWGQGHELKKMHVDDAWVITTGLYTIVPSNWRYADRGERDFDTIFQKN